MPSSSERGLGGVLALLREAADGPEPEPDACDELASVTKSLTAPECVGVRITPAQIAEIRQVIGEFSRSARAASVEVKIARTLEVAKTLEFVLDQGVEKMHHQEIAKTHEDIEKAYADQELCDALDQLDPLRLLSRPRGALGTRSRP